MSNAQWKCLVSFKAIFRISPFYLSITPIGQMKQQKNETKKETRVSFQGTWQEAESRQNCLTPLTMTSAFRSALCSALDFLRLSREIFHLCNCSGHANEQTVDCWYAQLSLPQWRTYMQKSQKQREPCPLHPNRPATPRLWSHAVAFSPSGLSIPRGPGSSSGKRQATSLAKSIPWRPVHDNTSVLCYLNYQ